MSLFDRGRIRRVRDGFDLRLPDQERGLLIHLPEQLSVALDDVTADGGIPTELRRLFPPAHSIDVAAESRYVEANRERFITERRDALECIARTAQAEHITDDEADEWLGAINSLRLVIGTRLGVTEELRAVDEADPSFYDWVCYQYLSFIESELVESMMGALPPPIPGAGDDLPDDPWGDPLGGLRWDGTPIPEQPLE